MFNNVFLFLYVVGLQTAYTERKGLYSFIRKVLALPFLPHEHIATSFTQLTEESQVTDDERLAALMQYVRVTWLDNTVWSVGNWCVFMQPIRTNNDVEGWHRRLNGQARRGRLPLYLLIKLLSEEARIAALQTELVSHGSLKRYQRLKYAKLQGRLFDLWEEYIDGQRTTSSLLKSCASLYNPSPETDLNA